MRRLWAHRDARLYIAGQGLSTVGDSALRPGRWPAGSAVSCLLLMAPWLPAVAAAMVVLGTGVIWVNVGAVTLLQRRTPPGLLGRVSAAFMVCVQVPQAASIALGAALVAVVDYRVLLAVMAAVVMISAGYLARGVVPAAAGEAGRRGPATADAGADKA